MRTRVNPEKLFSWAEGATLVSVRVSEGVVHVEFDHRGSECRTVVETDPPNRVFTLISKFEHRIDAAGIESLRPYILKMISPHVEHLREKIKSWPKDRRKQLGDILKDWKRPPRVNFSEKKQRWTPMTVSQKPRNNEP